MRKKESLPLGKTWMYFENIMLSEKSDRKIIISITGGIETKLNS